jgi:hypothetical protein
MIPPVRADVDAKAHERVKNQQDDSHDEGPAGSFAGKSAKSGKDQDRNQHDRNSDADRSVLIRNRHNVVGEDKPEGHADRRVGDDQDRIENGKGSHEKEPARAGSDFLLKLLPLDLERGRRTGGFRRCGDRFRGWFAYAGARFGLGLRRGSFGGHGGDDNRSARANRFKFLGWPLRLAISEGADFGITSRHGGRTPFSGEDDLDGGGSGTDFRLRRVLAGV